MPVALAGDPDGEHAVQHGAATTSTTHPAILQFRNPAMANSFHSGSPRGGLLLRVRRQLGRMAPHVVDDQVADLRTALAVTLERFDRRTQLLMFGGGALDDPEPSSFHRR